MKVNDIAYCGQQNSKLRVELSKAVGRALYSSTSDKDELVDGLNSALAILNGETELELTGELVNDSVLSGGVIHINLTVTNTGPSPATNVVIPFPNVSGMTKHSVTTPAVGSYVSPNWVITSLSKGNSGTIGFRYTLASDTPSDAEFTSTIDGDASGTETVNAPSDIVAISVSELYSVDPVVAEGTTVATLTVTCDTEDLYVSLSNLAYSSWIESYTIDEELTEGTVDGGVIHLTDTSGGKDIVLNITVKDSPEMGQDTLIVNLGSTIEDDDIGNAYVAFNPPTLDVGGE